jgi:hypothetical protein
VPAFPTRAAGDDHGTGTSGQRAGDIRVGDRVEAQLHQVGVASRLFAPLAKIRERRGADGHAQLGHKIRKPLAPVW